MCRLNSSRISLRQKRRVESRRAVRSGMLAAEKEAATLGKRRRKDLYGARAPRDTGVSLFLSRIQSGTLRATLGAHVRRSIAHELEIYGTRARRWHGCTAEAAPHRGRSSSLHRRCSHIFQIAQPPISTIANRKRDRGTDGTAVKGDDDVDGWTVDVGRRDGEEMMCTSCTQFIPTAERNTCSPPRIYLFVGMPIFISALHRLRTSSM